MTMDASSGSSGALTDEHRAGSEEQGSPRRAEAPPGKRMKKGGGDGHPALNEEDRRANRRRTFFILLGVALFALVYLSPAPPNAVDPMGQSFALGREGRLALGLFFLAATWWVTEVVPIGITAITIGVVQSLFLIRPARDAFTDYMDPSVWFIFGSLMIGISRGAWPTRCWPSWGSGPA